MFNILNLQLLHSSLTLLLGRDCNYVNALRARLETTSFSLCKRIPSMWSVFIFLSEENRYQRGTTDILSFLMMGTTYTQHIGIQFYTTWVFSLLRGFPFPMGGGRIRISSLQRKKALFISEGKSTAKPFLTGFSRKSGVIFLEEPVTKRALSIHLLYCMVLLFSAVHFVLDEKISPLQIKIMIYTKHVQYINSPNRSWKV